jgi:hypothetical protein
MSLGSNFTALQSKFGTLCTRYNGVVNTRLQVDMSSPVPNIDQRLFPSSLSAPC